MSEERKKYEISFLTENESGKQAVMDQLNQIGAEINFEGRFADIRLAYPIKKHLSAWFGFIHFEADPAKIASLNKELEFMGGLLRFLIITPPPIKSNPTMRTISSREERGMVPAENEAEPVIKTEEVEDEVKEEPAVEPIKEEPAIEETKEVAIEETPDIEGGVKEGDMEEEDLNAKNEVSDEDLDKKLDEIFN